MMSRSKAESEKLMTRVWHETQKGTRISTGEEKIVVEAIRVVLRYFAMADYLDGSKHSQMIAALYLSARYKTQKPYGKQKRQIAVKTKIGIAEEIFVSERTLVRYSNQYIKCFEKALCDLGYNP